MLLGQGDVALVSGGASGLGLGTVCRLVGFGARVVVLDRDPTAGRELADRLPGAVDFVEGDVRDEDAVQRAVDRAAEHGTLRAAVSCAGTGLGVRTVGRGGPHGLAEFQRVIEINLIGTFNVCRLAAASMAGHDLVDGERGVVVTTASVAAYDGQIGQVAYAASKGGIVSMTLPMARDLASLAIRVVTIAPGIFDTPLLSALPEEAKASLGSQVPHPPRLGRPEEYADLVTAVIANPMLNGETIRLDGAIRMAPR